MNDSLSNLIRVALVLTGLPPEPQRLSAFLADEREDAFERLHVALEECLKQHVEGTRDNGFLLYKSLLLARCDVALQPDGSLVDLHINVKSA